MIAPVTMFQNMQVGPHDGLASEMKPHGTIMTAPTSGPRTYQSAGTTLMPTATPISRRAR